MAIEPEVKSLLVNLAWDLTKSSLSHAHCFSKGSLRAGIDETEIAEIIAIFRENYQALCKAIEKN